MSEEKQQETKKPDREAELKQSREAWRQGRKERLAKTNSNAKDAQTAALDEMQRPKKDRM